MRDYSPCCESRQSSGSEIDLIIADVRRPGCTGLQVLEQLRFAGDGVPVILMSAFGDEDLRREAKRHDVILLDKPFALDDLRGAVNDVLRRAW